jgi:hypothetical protein
MAAFSINTGDDVVGLVMRVHRGEKYLQSEAEKTHPDDLIHLMVSQAAAAAEIASAPVVQTGRRTRR